ncbi:hypothetical protein GY45DRAFT_1429729 [Cubamyces sp. BRFM 1775]|nr:hypothetical protein GY45DRAFT_1429729 [Cubamyces sp. BRFM 1775]
MHHQWQVQSSDSGQANLAAASGEKKTDFCRIPTKIAICDPTLDLKLVSDRLSPNSSCSASSLPMVHRPYRFCLPCKGIVSRGQAHLTSSPNHPNCAACRLGFENEEQLSSHLIAKNTCDVCAVHHDSPEALHEHCQTSIQHKGANIMNRTRSLANLIVEAVAESIVNHDAPMTQPSTTDGGEGLIRARLADPVRKTRRRSLELHSPFPGAYPDTLDEKVDWEANSPDDDTDTLILSAMASQGSGSDIATEDHSDVEDEDDFYDLSCEISYFE